MKKRTIILCTGALSLAMLSGCGAAKQTENTAGTTAAVETTAAAETTTTPETTTDAETATDAETPASADAAETESAGNTTDTDSPENADSEAETEDAYADSITLMQTIYEIHPGSSGASLRAEEAAENLKNYVSSYGADTSLSFETLANDWFETMTETEGADIRTDFKECFEEAVSAAKNSDETLEKDTAFLNVINGISAAIGK